MVFTPRVWNFGGVSTESPKHSLEFLYSDGAGTRKSPNHWAASKTSAPHGSSLTGFPEAHTVQAQLRGQPRTLKEGFSRVSRAPSCGPPILPAPSKSQSSLPPQLQSIAASPTQQDCRSLDCAPELRGRGPHRGAWVRAGLVPVPPFSHVLSSALIPSRA